MIGVLREAYERESTDAEIVSVFRTAVDDLRRAGATMIDPAKVDGLENCGVPTAPGRAWDSSTI